MRDTMQCWPFSMKWSKNTSQTQPHQQWISSAQSIPSPATFWDETTKKVSLIELTVCFDTLFEGAIKRKEDRYQELLDTIQMPDTQQAW